MSGEQPQRVVVTPTKSVGLSVFLAALFGPIGMLYSTIWGGIIMLAVSALIGPLTLGLGLIFIWPVCVLWAALATVSYNKRLLSGRRQF